MALVALILRWWRARQRRIDLEILWPSLKAAADFNRAKAAFMRHALLDPAWLELGEDELFAFLAELQ
jgi:hypothetical protein